MGPDRLADIQLDPALPPCGEAVEQERRVAIADLLGDNAFTLPAGQGRGPWRLALGLRDRRLVFALAALDGRPAAEFHLSLGPFRQVLKDYDAIRAAHAGALASLAPAQVETVDMARRGIHDEGARILQDRLGGKAQMDHATARRLFTLICALGA